jgi:hypothetical protein
MNRNLLVFLALFLHPLFVQSQTSGFKHWRDEIAFNADIMVNADQDSHRMRAQGQLEAAMDSFLSMDGSYAVSLDSIPWISVLHAGGFRIITWQLRISDEEYKYGGFIQWPDRVVHFRDSRPFINGSAYTTYTPSGWYGCLYYKIIPFKKDGTEYYALLGFNAENSRLNTKLADVLDLTGPEPRLGLPVFTGNGEARTRILMSYADVSTAHMTYDEQLGGIVHDHLESLPGVGLDGESMPVSDGSLEAWILKKGNWVYEEEVYDVKQNEPPMSDERKDRKEDKDILGRPKKQ